MRIRGVLVALLVALICGLVGLGGGAGVAYLVQPDPRSTGQATPVPAYSPSVPFDPPSRPTYAPDIDYAALPADLTLPVAHRIHNDLVVWTYHVPQDWQAYGVCTFAPCRVPTDAKIPPKKVDRQNQVRFRPPGEPLVGGYSLRVKVMDNTELDPSQMVATKVVGFRQAYGSSFSISRRAPGSVYFTYTDGDDHLRYNYFSWFAAPGHSNATLEMSVSGRMSDRAGLTWLFDRFADNVTAEDVPAPGGPGSVGRALSR